MTASKMVRSASPTDGAKVIRYSWYPNRGGADDQQEQPADHLEDFVETLEGDAHQKGAIKQIPALEAVH